MRAFILWALAVLATAPSPAAGLRSDETLLLFPALAAPATRGGTNGWEFDLHGIIYEPGSRPLAVRALRRLAGFDGDKLSAEERTIFNDRASLFLVDNERGKHFTLEWGGARYPAGPSTKNGHFSTRLFVEAARLPNLGGRDGAITVPVRVSSDGGEPRALILPLHLPGDTGLSVISDIDDTIKISDVRDHGELARNTFCRPCSPAPGLAALYQSWTNTRPVQFHYVTASPWQLYLPLAEFVRGHGFPAGTFHMKHFRLQDGSFVKLFTSPERYKPGVIEPLLARFPRRAFVLVGDSGERDPEIYGEVARRHPRQVRRIFIRDVTGEPASAPRYGKCFRGLPGEMWQVFRHPDEVRPDRLLDP